MAHPYAATLRLDCDDAAEADALEGALAVEAAASLPKARLAVRRDGLAVLVEVAARDAATLRAAVNSFLRWARVAEESARAARPRVPQEKGS